jgi:hypothetical protein
MQMIKIVKLASTRIRKLQIQDLLHLRLIQPRQQLAGREKHCRVVGLVAQRRHHAGRTRTRSRQGPAPGQKLARTSPSIAVALRHVINQAAQLGLAATSRTVVSHAGQQQVPYEPEHAQEHAWEHAQEHAAQLGVETLPAGVQLQVAPVQARTRQRRQFRMKLRQRQRQLLGLQIRRLLRLYRNGDGRLLRKNYET